MQNNRQKIKITQRTLTSPSADPLNPTYCAYSSDSWFPVDEPLGLIRDEVDMATERHHSTASVALFFWMSFLFVKLSCAPRITRDEAAATLCRDASLRYSLDTVFFFPPPQPWRVKHLFFFFIPPEVISNIHCDCILIKSRHFNHLWHGVGERGCGVINPLSLPITHARAYSHTCTHAHTMSDLLCLAGCFIKWKVVINIESWQGLPENPVN